MLTLIGICVTVFSFALLAQSLFTVYLMLYTWWQPDRLDDSKSPQIFSGPTLSFTVLLPARHERDVIFETLQHILDANYPDHLVQIVVICEANDVETIAEARRAIGEREKSRAAVVTFSDGPINKPHGLNVGLAFASGEIVTVFDAEDNIHPDIFNVINTIMLRERVRVVQSGVQLMNHTSPWFSALNVMEYYFWFKSQLHFHARAGMIPLGGNSVFIARGLLEGIGGWDEHCLTEDADVGVRLSALGERIRVVYDPLHVTQEETPPTLRSFVRQRTRWNQGFLQVLLKRDWIRLPTLQQRALAAYTLSAPFFQAVLVLVWPVSLLMILYLKLPIPFTLASLSPLYTLFFFLLFNLLGLWEFTRLYQRRFPIIAPIKIAAAFLPYNLVLSISAFRAVYRALRKQANWEKTRHVGAHRPGIVGGV